MIDKSGKAPLLLSGGDFLNNHAAVIVLVYLVVGALCLCYLEEWSPSDSLYFCIVSLTTVGYGDMSGHTTFERIFCIVLMVIGVVVFTFVSGALSSILSSFDSSNAKLQDRIMFLNKLQNQYKLSCTLYNEVCQKFSLSGLGHIIAIEGWSKLKNCVGRKRLRILRALGECLLPRLFAHARQGFPHLR